MSRPPASLDLHASLRFVPGVGPRRAEALAAKGYELVEDLLYHLPFRYEDRSQTVKLSELVPGHAETVLATVLSARLVRTRRRNFSIFRCELGDETGSVPAVFYNQPYLARTLTPGRRAYFYGELRAARGGRGALQLENPDFETVEEEGEPAREAGRIVPVYERLGPFTPKGVRRLAAAALERLATPVPELLPAAVLEAEGLPGRERALREAHWPPPGSSLLELERGRGAARRRLAFEELYLLQLGLALRRRGVRRETRGIAYRIDEPLRRRLAGLLPFRLTGAQHRVLDEIGADLRSPHPMNRLLQGDVGSGKTIVAVLAMLVAADNGYQAALMAPTEILAEQHALRLRELLAGHPYEISLLTAGGRAAERRAEREAVAEGRSRIVVGTHALVQEAVAFERLGLVVIDEQHRFGVLQRAALVEKGWRPDVLVLTATPIPRTLALTVYGDLDVSIIDEKPPGRRPVETVLRRESEREKVFEALDLALERGRQAYVVYPLVEETGKSDLRAATEGARALQERLPGRRVGLLTGRMKAEEKSEVMREFAAGRIAVLVATTVVEVGVDVPNASVMIVEHAERFGLSQLHQLRGRVGRGRTRSYCVLVAADGAGEAGRRRLETLSSTEDGFRIAEVDLEMRGPGELMGTAQHGMPDLRVAHLVRDQDLMQRARRRAFDLVEKGGRELEEQLRALDGRVRQRFALLGTG